jgi:hypothetical protein
VDRGPTDTLLYQFTSRRLDVETTGLAVLNRSCKQVVNSFYSDNSTKCLLSNGVQDANKEFVDTVSTHIY